MIIYRNAVGLKKNINEFTVKIRLILHIRLQYFNFCVKRKININNASPMLHLLELGDLSLKSRFILQSSY